MRNTERFARLLAGDTAIDRTPVIEWASWWDLTYKNWFQQGLPQMSPEELNVYWGHDPLKQFWLPVIEEGCPQPDHFGGPIIEDEEDYKRVHKYLFTDRLLEQIDKNVGDYARAHADEDIAYWFSLDGFFWFPRRLFGIEGHLLAFYDYPELMLEINRDLCEFHKKCLKVLFSRIKPLFMTFGEDMSYNLGPMLSKECYDEFMLPFYKELVPLIKAGGHQGAHRHRRPGGAPDSLVPGRRHRGHTAPGAHGRSGCESDSGKISGADYDRRLRQDRDAQGRGGHSGGIRADSAGHSFRTLHSFGGPPDPSRRQRGGLQAVHVHPAGIQPENRQIKNAAAKAKMPLPPFYQGRESPARRRSRIF